MALTREVRRIAIVGIGPIGASWAAFYLARGFDVIATDPDPRAEASARHYIDRAWPALKVLGTSPKGSPEHVYFKSSIAEAVAKADFIQESGPDHAELKIRLVAEIDRSAPAGSIIASSSAGLTMSVIQSACAHPERCVIGHPLNPPHIMPLVEVAGGEKTSLEAIRQAISFYASIGKKPIFLRKEVAGHAAGRLEAALFREIAELIGQGVLDVPDAEAAVYWGPGLRWGIMGPNLLPRLGNPERALDFEQNTVDRVAPEVEDRPLEELARERDELLVGFLRLREEFSKSSSPGRKSGAGGRRRPR